MSGREGRGGLRGGQLRWRARGRVRGGERPEIERAREGWSYDHSKAPHEVECAAGRGHTRMGEQGERRGGEWEAERERRCVNAAPFVNLAATFHHGVVFSAQQTTVSPGKRIKSPHCTMPHHTTVTTPPRNAVPCHATLPCVAPAQLQNGCSMKDLPHLTARSTLVSSASPDSTPTHCRSCCSPSGFIPQVL